MVSESNARELAGELLGVDSRRWRHSAAVAAQARRLSECDADVDADQLVAAAWLHDIGYADAINDSGFHPLDGARFLRRQGEEVLACLAAHHSSSDVEARHRGLSGQLEQFELPAGVLLDALTFCDMTSGPTGERVSFDERLAEILERYGPDHVVGRSIRDAEGSLRAAVDRFAHLL